MRMLLWLRDKLVLAGTSCAILSVLAFVSCLGVAVMGVLGLVVGFMTLLLLSVLQVLSSDSSEDWLTWVPIASAVICIAWGQLKIFQDGGMRVLWRDLARCILLLLGRREVAERLQVLERGARSSEEEIHA